MLQRGNPAWPLPRPVSRRGSAESASPRGKTEREKGAYFELLTKDFLKNDPAHSPQFPDVWVYAKRADLQGIAKWDEGIDPVASLANGDEFCAIQCKFYDKNHRMQKADMDSLQLSLTSLVKLADRITM